MSNAIHVLNLAPETNGPARRCRAFAAVWERLAAATGRVPDRGNEATNLEALAVRGCLALDVSSNASERAVLFTPTSEACCDAISETSEKAWPSRVQGKHHRALAPQEGALFRFDVEGSEEILEAFITDWSPFPAACALAIFSGHPLDPRTGGENYFTGRFARHPLTSDLIPVWVADWVKPEFGTGVVVVNPAHCEVDLEFARRVGLPIRFSLVPENLSSNEWPTPPVIRTGKAIRTAIADGAGAEEAAAKYLEILIARNKAVRCSSFRRASAVIGTFRLSAEGPFQAEASGRLRLRGDQGVSAQAAGSAGNVDLAPWAHAILTASAGVTTPVVCQLTDAQEHLLSARLLFYDCFQQFLVPQPLCLVQDEFINCDADVTEEEMRVASVCGDATQPLNFKKVCDRVRAFIKRHQAISETRGGTSSVPNAARVSSDGFAEFQSIQQDIEKGAFDQAFKRLGDIQKRIVGDAALPLADYSALCHALTGLPA